MVNLLDKVRQTIKKYSLIEEGDKILLGLSGGPDSIALFHLLFRLKKQLKFSLFLCHLNHCLRKEAGEEAHFVEELANSYSLPITIGKKNISKLKGPSLEEKARVARYRFFAHTAKKYQVNKIAIAHNLDDQAETVLLRIIRGAGLLGLGGMKIKRAVKGNAHLQIIRPLLEINRKKILEYLKKKKLVFATDKSNKSRIYLRNRVRLELLPLLAEYNPRIKESLAKLALACQEDFAFIEESASSFLPKILKRKDNKLTIDIKEFLKTPRSLQKEILRIALKSFFKKSLSFSAIESLQSLVIKDKGNLSLSLPGKLKATRLQNRLFLYVEKNKRKFPKLTI